MTVPGSANPLLLRSAAPTAYQVSRSLRFNAGDSAYISRVVSSAGNRKTFTLSWWMKKSGLTTFQSLFNSFTDSNNRFAINFDSSIGAGGAGDYLTMFNGNAGAFNNIFQTNALFRDASAWYHIVIAIDTTQASSGERVKLWVNGTLQTFSSYTAPSQNADLNWNSATTHYFGVYGGSPSTTAYGFNGYLAEVHHIDGQQLTPSSFAETDSTTSQWVPKLFSGSYGSQGWKLTFADNSNNTAATLGADTSSNGNNWTPNNLSVTAGVGNDALTDSPTSYGSGTSGGDVRGNFATLNPLDKASAFTLENGNLQGKSTSSFKSARATIGMPTGKWYWEHTIETISDMTGVQPAGAYLDSHIGTSGVGDSGVAYGYTTIYNQGSSSLAGGATSNGAVVSVAFDADGGKLWFRVNGGSWLSGDPAAGTSPSVSGLTGKTYFPAVTGYNNSAGMYLNFGQRAFAYTPPTNFNPLVDTYLPTPTVAKPSTVMDVKLYTGNGSTQTVSGLGFNPDLVWIKSRSNAYDHGLFDAVRGATNRLVSNATQAEDSQSGVTAFNSDGFSLGSYAGQNGSSATYAAWCWDAGTSTVTNTAGSITGGSQVRANPSSGFSVVTWTGQSAAATIGHGLNAAPSLIICKARSNAQSWGVYHKDVGINNYLLLDSTGASTAYSGIWGSTAPTSTVFSVPGNVGLNNYSGWTYVAYCFAPVAGYSSFGIWQHNNSNDGPFIYTGFRPKLILLKNSDNAEQWFMFDSARRTYNLAAGTDTSNLRPNSSGAEGSYSNQATIDFLSNGFKIRTTTPDEIAFGTRSYIYAAWAESPFQYARAR